jgi:hypothetical protein
MRAFDATRQVEAQAFAVLRPFIEQRSDGLVVTDKGVLAAFLQETCGDVITNINGRVFSIELKAENRHTGNLFLETWSNRNLNSKANHAMVGSNPGWMMKTRADLLFYYFIDADTLYIIDLFSLKQWAFGNSEAPGRVYAFREVAQSKYTQLNDTVGRIVPVDVLMRELRPQPKIIRDLSKLHEKAA